MITVADYAKKRKVSKFTVYSWIYKKKTKENGFEVIQVGNVKLINPIKKWYTPIYHKP